MPATAAPDVEEGLEVGEVEASGAELPEVDLARHAGLGDGPLGVLEVDDAVLDAVRHAHAHHLDGAGLPQPVHPVHGLKCERGFS